MKTDNSVTRNQVVFKTEGKEYREQLISMIRNSNQLQIISENAEQIIVISTQKAKSLKELFPKITPIKSTRNRTSFLTYYRMKNSKITPDSDIVNLSGVQIKKGRH